MKADVLKLAALAFFWGYAKSRSVNGETMKGDCADSIYQMARHSVSPSTLIMNAGLGPLQEEMLFRAGIQPKIGLAPTAAMFGAFHIRRLDAQNIAHATDAGLGGLLYGFVYNNFGLAASTMVHGAHNLGVAIGTLFSARHELGHRARAKKRPAGLQGLPRKLKPLARWQALRNDNERSQKSNQIGVRQLFRR
jgi:predicted membrane-bound spermidine synthase